MTRKNIFNNKKFKTYLASLMPVTGIIASLRAFSMLIRPIFSLLANKRNASGMTHVFSSEDNSWPKINKRFELWALINSS